MSWCIQYTAIDRLMLEYTAEHLTAVMARWPQHSSLNIRLITLVQDAAVRLEALRVVVVLYS